MLYLQKASAKTKDCLSSGKFIQSNHTSLLYVLWILLPTFFVSGCVIFFTKMPTTVATQTMYTRVVHSYKIIQEIRKRRQSLRKIESNRVLLILLFV